MDDTVKAKLDEHFSGGIVKTFPKGTVLTFAGEEPEGVSQLLEGIVEQYDITPEGNKIVVNIFKPPSYFPMSWAINHDPNNYFFSALTEVKLRQADAKATVDFLLANPDVTFDLLSRVYRGTDALLRRRVLTVNGIASSRLIFELLIEAYRFGDELTTGVRKINIKQQTLAARSGLARETVSRELHKLADEGLVELSKQGITVHIQPLEKKLDVNL